MAKIKKFPPITKKGEIKKKTGPKTDSPLNHVISFRINDAHYKRLADLALIAALDVNSVARLIVIDEISS